MPEKKEIISLLESIADLMEFNGENQFKVSAFRSGANSIRKSEGDLDVIVKEKFLNNIKGIGKGLQPVIYEYYENGFSNLLKELQSAAPKGIDDLLKVRGLGPKKIKQLYRELAISSIDELEYACKDNRLAMLKGFGENTQKKILEELEKIRSYSNFILSDAAEKLSTKIIDIISEFKSVKKIQTAGEIRRGMEIISSIDLVSLVIDKKYFLSELDKLFKFSLEEEFVLIKDNNPVTIKIFIAEKENEFVRTLFLTTGSDKFIERLKAGNQITPEHNEETIFQKLKVSYVIPEMREENYFQTSDSGLKENSDLTAGKFKGLLHFHTTSSDGTASLLEMISAAQKIGYRYAAVCNHSKSAFYANGLTEERVLQQKEEVEAVSNKMNFKIFHGVESDILIDGNLDYENDFLINFDFIVASVHSRFNLSEEEMTKRIIRAIENPFTDLLGHPTGRLLLSRDPYKLDIKKVIDACSSNKVAIEINAHPKRLDLDWRWIYYAREKECLFSINADAHSTEDILYQKYGIMVARKGGLKSSEVINCFEEKKFKTFLCRKVERNLG
ncbi:MAG: helix-hairpin-helix domain-containing protein [Ignavibacteriaceae bacterium]